MSAIIDRLIWTKEVVIYLFMKYLVSNAHIKIWSQLYAWGQQVKICWSTQSCMEPRDFECQWVVRLFMDCMQYISSLTLLFMLYWSYFTRWCDTQLAMSLCSPWPGNHSIYSEMAVSAGGYFTNILLTVQSSVGPRLSESQLSKQ